MNIRLISFFIFLQFWISVSYAQEIDSIKTDTINLVDIDSTLLTQDDSTNLQSSILLKNDSLESRPIVPVFISLSSNLESSIKELVFVADSFQDQNDNSISQQKIDISTKKDSINTKTSKSDTNKVKILDEIAQNDSSGQNLKSIAKSDSALSSQQKISPIIMDTVSTPKEVSPKVNPIINSDITTSKNQTSKQIDLHVQNGLITENITFVIHVEDSNSHVPLQANIRMVLVNDNARDYKGTGKCNGEGEFNIVLSPKSKFVVHITCPNYSSYSNNFDMNDVEGNQVFQNIYLKSLKIGDIFVLQSVRFEQGKFNLLNTSHDELDNLVALLNENPKLVIKLCGHTDNTGNSVALQHLSEQRVREVKYYLIENGIKSHRIKGEGYGGSRPIYNGNDPKKLVLNRRVEFEVLKL